MCYRAIWISDVHLGTPQCAADALLTFLDRHDCDYLYLVGDIIDFWRSTTIPVPALLAAAGRVAR